MPRLRWGIVAAGTALAVVAEWSAYDAGDTELAVADGVVGMILIVCGVVGWERRGRALSASASDIATSPTAHR